MDKQTKVMPEVKRAPERKLEPGEVESINQDIAEKEAMLKATSEFMDGAPAPAVPEEIQLDKGRLAGEVKRLRELRDSQMPERISDQGKRMRIEQRRRELEHKFTQFLETRQDIDVTRRDSPEYRAAVKKSLMRPRVEHLIAEWRELGKMLEPEDPEINNLDRLRKDR